MPPSPPSLLFPPSLSLHPCRRAYHGYSLTGHKAPLPPPALPQRAGFTLVRHDSPLSLLHEHAPRAAAATAAGDVDVEPVHFGRDARQHPSDWLASVFEFRPEVLPVWAADEGDRVGSRSKQDDRDAGLKTESACGDNDRACSPPHLGVAVTFWTSRWMRTESLSGVTCCRDVQIHGAITSFFRFSMTRQPELRCFGLLAAHPFV